MRNQILSLAVIAALAMPAGMLLSGCDREVAHTEKTSTNSDGTSSKTESTTVEKPNGAMEKSTEKSVDKMPNH